MKRPHRRHTVTVTVHADNPKEVSSALEAVLFWWFEHLKHDGTTTAGNTFSGGVSSGWHAVHVLDPKQTHDRYFKQLEAYRIAIGDQQAADISPGDEP